MPTAEASTGQDNHEMNNLFFSKTTVVGVGLIGASVALALKEKGLCGVIYGYGREEENLKKAKERGIIDDYSLDVCKACEGSDLILLSTPVGVFREIVEKIKGTIKKGALITDVGSVKGSLVYELESLMPAGVYYVGSHPIAGSDKSGIDDARAGLFTNTLCVITETENSGSMAIQKIASIWEAVGARVVLMDTFKHDEIYAAVSHLPHIIAYAMVNTVNDISADYIEYAGQGFRDTTRIALSSPELWRDISMFNKDNLIKLINTFKDNLDRITRCLENGDALGIEKDFLKAQELRRRLK